jgi:hypothetical protein
MAVSLENTGSLLQAPASSGTITGFTITSANVLVVGVGYTDGGVSVTSVVWDAAGVNQALTQVKYQREGVFTGFVTEIWYLVNPTAGSSKSITITMSGSGQGFAGVAAGFAGGNTTTPFGDMTLTGGTADSEGGASDPITVTVTTASGETVFDMVCGETASTVGVDQAVILNDNATFGRLFASSYQDGLSGGEMSWTKNGGGTQAWCISAVSLKAAAGGGPSRTDGKLIFAAA